MPLGQREGIEMILPWVGSLAFSKTNVDLFHELFRSKKELSDEAKYK
jgi:hypothetical protein